MANVASAPLSDAELAWQKEFVFDHHETAAVYKRKTSFEVDTILWKDFNTALSDETSVADVRTESDAHDNGRYAIIARINESPGFLALYLSAKSGSIAQDVSARHVTYYLSARIPGSGKILFNRGFDYTFREECGYGSLKTVSLAAIRADPDFKALPQKRLLFKAEIEERLSSAKNDFLLKPTFGLATLVKALDHVQRFSGDTVIKLGDGQSTAYSEILKAKCEHFKTVFSSEFREAREAPAAASTALTSEDSVIDEGEQLVDYDSDFNEKFADASSSDEVRRDLKLVKLPNFSKATFDAFVLYLYTGSITFKPLRSSAGARQLPNEVSMKAINKQVCPCSPKSMYAMADFDVPALKELCKTAFLAMIHPGNILRELAHRFGRLHKPIANELEAYAVKNWSQIAATSTFDDDMQAVMECDDSRRVLFSVLKSLKVTKP